MLEEVAMLVDHHRLALIALLLEVLGEWFRGLVEQVE